MGDHAVVYYVTLTDCYRAISEFYRFRLRTHPRIRGLLNGEVSRLFIPCAAPGLRGYPATQDAILHLAPFQSDQCILVVTAAHGVRPGLKFDFGSPESRYWIFECCDNYHMSSAMSFELEARFGKELLAQGPPKHGT